MGKMNNLSLDLDCLRNCITNLNGVIATIDEIATEINNIVDDIESEFSSSQEEKKSVTLEEVRAILAEKSRNGKTAEVKELLTKFGVNKLSELDALKYDELLKESEVI